MNKNELLAKIEPLFYEKTFKEISLDIIAKHLEMKKASLYYYFSSKENLIEELVNYSFNNYKNFIVELCNKDWKNWVEEFLNYSKDSKIFFL